MFIKKEMDCNFTTKEATLLEQKRNYNVELAQWKR
jgi:hypothetical protein